MNENEEKVVTLVQFVVPSIDATLPDQLAKALGLNLYGGPQDYLVQEFIVLWTRLANGQSMSYEDFIGGMRAYLDTDFQCVWARRGQHRSAAALSERELHCLFTIHSETKHSGDEPISGALSMLGFFLALAWCCDDEAVTAGRASLESLATSVCASSDAKDVGQHPRTLCSHLQVKAGDSAPFCFDVAPNFQERTISHRLRVVSDEPRASSV